MVVGGGGGSLLMWEDTLSMTRCAHLLYQNIKQIEKNTQTAVLDALSTTRFDGKSFFITDLFCL